MPAPETLWLDIDCHAHDFDGTDGYLDLVGIAETYGILIRKGDSHPLRASNWATWYVIVGPHANLKRFLTEEVWGDDALAEDALFWAIPFDPADPPPEFGGTW